MHFFYLHGFASSPQSTKAQFFAAQLGAWGMKLRCPDFNEPDFSALTISRMLQQVDESIAALPPGDVVLMGSSLGGFVAVEAAARGVRQASHRIAQLILLAPAVELEWERWSEVGPGGIDRWRRVGSIEIFHYGYGEPRRLNFSFHEDAIRYAPATERLETPMLIFQGWHDESVRPATVERFARAQPRATLHMLDDDHQLKSSLDLIWREVAALLALSP
jgi:pimeloyl-ACP methyl ester carboxylesterase